jgi:YVTN family beta-propeller protein
MRRLFAVLVSALLLALAAAAAEVIPDAFVNFEGAQTNPVRLSADGTRLFAVNTPDARLSVFDLTDPSTPRLVDEIPVGIEPVSVNPRTNDEVWVVNQVSDSISVVSVSQGIVIDTLYVEDEPADVVFVPPNLAFVSVARSNDVRVFDATTRTHLKSIALFGNNPRALAVNAAGTRVYVAFALSGNRTTILPPLLAPPQPPATDPTVPPPPEVGLIIDAADPQWAPALRYTVRDLDVAEIDTATLQVSRYFPGVGTINLGLAVHPTTDSIYVANTDARNLVRFQPALRGHWVDNRITRITQGGRVTPFDLNAGIDYSLNPNPAARATALSQPTGLVVEPQGRWLYAAAFGTDRVAVVDLNTGAISRIEIGPGESAIDPRNKRGPRGLALAPAAERLYVLNRISNTISIVDTSSQGVIGEIPVGSFDPTPAAIRDGRGFLYDAKLSGNGTGACASCHVDADMDLLAWDLGDPDGAMEFVVQGRFTTPMHPLKGPLVTQTLRGLKGVQPYHWRGDREDFRAFNPAFDALMGGSPLSGEDMDAYTEFINTIQFQPNPHQNLDRTLPALIGGGDPRIGRDLFLTQPFDPATSAITCSSCHFAEPGAGTNTKIIRFLFTPVQPFKVPQLRNVYQKLNFTKRKPASIDGFGLVHDGSVMSVFELLSEPRFGALSQDSVSKIHLSAFVTAFDTGTAPAVGYSRTFTAASLGDSAAMSDWALLERQAAAGNIDLIVKGTIDSARRGLLYRPVDDDYRADTIALSPLSRIALTARLLAGDTLTVMGVPPGSGVRMGVDRDLDGVLDGDESVGNARAEPDGLESGR